MVAQSHHRPRGSRYAGGSARRLLHQPLGHGPREITSLPAEVRTAPHKVRVDARACGGATERGKRARSSAGLSPRMRGSPEDLEALRFSQDVVTPTEHRVSQSFQYLAREYIQDRGVIGSKGYRTTSNSLTPCPGRSGSPGAALCSLSAAKWSEQGQPRCGRLCEQHRWQARSPNFWQVTVLGLGTNALLRAGVNAVGEMLKPRLRVVGE